MPPRDIIVIGASAGGLQPLTQLVAEMPADLPAAIFVVMHVSPYHRSTLPEILSRSGPLPASHARHGERVEPGRIYVAPPDCHLLLRDGTMELSRSARENRTRPSIDPLFRTAARAYGPRVSGVILSGTQGDGTVGLMAIKTRGGVSFVQDPDEVLYSGMPRRAIDYADVDYVRPVREISSLLVALARQETGPDGGGAMGDSGEDFPPIIAQGLWEQAANRRGGQTATFSCPECGGVLWQLEQGTVVQFHCHVGHTYSPELLLVEKSEGLETALWAAVRTLVEKATLTRQLAERMREEGDPARAAAVAEQADLDEEHIHLIRNLILGAIPNPATASYQVSELLESSDAERQEDRQGNGAG
jgi:two-component system chemotaxis response regulator CheB